MPENTQEVNVRVAVRIRPLLPKEKLSGEQTCVKLIPSNNQIVLGKDRAFTFDNVLSSKTSQEDVYKTCVDQLVTKFFQGYNATVFAYGQTGSGKTFTVGSGNITVQTESDFGVVPRAVRRMFEHMEANPQRDYLIKVSYLELYKEELVDLLDLETSSKDLHIREDDKGNTLIMGISEVTCQSLEDVMEYLQRGSTFRHTGSTQMNEHSSRSHTVFSITIEQTWTDDDTDEHMSVSSRRIRKTVEYDPELIDNGEVHHYMCAKFHFVDLAGSERARRTGNIGDRFKESVHINSGLLALGNVISALGDPKKKAHHIPYRDSKITRILKDSLGGNANTLMICCVSPCVSSFDESLNAVKFANRARNIKNKPVVNRDQQSIRFEEMQCEIKALREELNRQRTSMIPGSLDPDVARAIGEVGQIKDMEDKISRIETECSHYRLIADEAYKQFLAIQDKNILSNSMDGRLNDWLELMEEIKNKVPGTLSAEAWQNQTIVRLEDQLKQAQHDLKSDEEIFTEKSKEVTTLKDRIEELETVNQELQDQLQESSETVKQQEDQLVSQQVLIEQLQAQLKEKDRDLEDMESIGDPSDLLGESGPLTTNRRAKSVPVQMLGNRSARSELGAPATRNIHTSPALISLERVMAGFRARSQLLASRLDESDEVLQQHFSDTSDEDDVVRQQTSKNGGAKGKRKRDKSPFQRNTSSRGTYRVSKPRFSTTQGSQDSGSGEPKLPHILQTDDAKWMIKKSQENLNFSKASKGIIDTGTKVLNLEGYHEEITASQRQRQLKESEIGVRQSTQKIRDLSINIRMKEQLIRELIKSSKESQNMNKQYESRIKSLEKERQEIKLELSALQKAVQEAESKDKTEKDKIQGEFRKKMEVAKLRLQNLSKKQRETEKMAVLTGANDRRVGDLERAVDKMRQEQDNLQKKLKEESEKKQRLQREMQKEQQRVRELETKNEQQKKILRVKTEEAAAANRRLRSVSGLNRRSPMVHHNSTFHLPRLSEEQTKLEEQRKWLDAEMEKVLDQRKKVEELEKDLLKREELVVKKEAMLAEKSELQMKKMRSSQVLSKEFQSVSNSLVSLDRKIQEKNQEIVSTPRDKQSKIMEELQALTHGKDRLAKQRHALDEKIQDGAVLSTQEERRLIELDEALEALDAAIEFKNEAIQNRQQELRNSSVLTKSEDNLLSRLNTLSVGETRSLLTKYFEKVIDLREGERKKGMECSELQMQIEELENQIQEMESSLERAAMETDRRLTLQQQDYEKKMQLLMHQLSEAENQQFSGRKDSSAEKDVKLAQLEKDLYYYKKTSRELKKKLRELLASYSATTPDPNREKLKDEIIESIGKSPMTNRDGSSSSRPATQSGSSTSHKSENGKESHRLSSRASGSPRMKPPEGTESATSVRISKKELRRMSAEEVSLRMSSVTDAAPSDSLDASQYKSSNA